MIARHTPSRALVGVAFALGGALASAPAADVWRITVVDGPGAGAYSSLAILPSGQPAISYYDRENGDLKYAWLEQGTWQTATADSAGNVGGYTSLAVLPSGQPAVSYFDFTNLALKYAWLDGSDWHVSTVDNGQDGTFSAGRFSSLVILPDGRPAISYTAGNALRFAVRTGDDWQIATIDQHVGVSSLTVLPSGHPAIAYSDYTDYTLKYAWFDGADWRASAIDPSAVALHWLSLTVLPSGRPAVCYRSYRSSQWSTVDEVRYAERVGATWMPGLVGLSWQRARSIDLALQPSGTPAFACALRDGEVCYARLVGEWQTGGPDTGTESRKSWTSLAFLPSGQPAISYFDEATSELNYAYAFLTGDANCDGVINAYDIDAFICALSPACDYAVEYPSCDESIADCNGDGIVNSYDIDPFIALLGGK